MIEKNIEKRKVAKRIIGTAITVNIGMLVIFKYSNFLVDNVNVLLREIGLYPIYFDNIDLPIGISFYTFQAISYLVDIYRRETKAQVKIIDHALYISLFPQLVAGPIVRYSDVAMQIRTRKSTLEDVEYGIRRFILGLGKKILISNPLGKTADSIFLLNEADLSTGIAWVGIICYTMQIYYDFSGYSDMAIGLGRIFGFKFLENFNYPYISKSIKEFWRRWHISLSSWFRDYVYIPLGGSRTTALKTSRNLLIVFILTGFWHGASWNFIIWGLFHGVFLLLERTQFGKILEKTWYPVKLVYTLLVVMSGWVFFKAETLGDSITFLGEMFGFFSNESPGLFNASMYMNNEIVIVLVIAIIGATPLPKKVINKVSSYIYDKKSTFVRIAYDTCTSGYHIILLVFSIMSLATSTYNPFIYFRF